MSSTKQQSTGYHPARGKNVTAGYTREQHAAAKAASKKRKSSRKSGKDFGESKVANRFSAVNRAYQRPAAPAKSESERLNNAKFNLVVKVLETMEKRGQLNGNSDEVRKSVVDYLDSLVVSDGIALKPEALSQKKAKAVVDVFLELAPQIIIAKNLSSMAGWRVHSHRLNS